MSEGTLSPPRVAIVSLTLALTGALVGSGLAQLAAARVLVLARAPSLRLPRVERQEAPPIGALLAPAPPEGGDGDPPAAASCDPAWRVVGLALFPDAPERSIVAVRTASGAAVLGGGEAEGAWTVVSVGRDSLTLRSEEGGECVVATNDERPRDALASEQPELASSLVEALGDGRYRLERAAIEQASLQPVRLVPRVDERGSSVRVYGVRRGSLASEAGLRNGDVVTAIDGQPPTSERGLDAYARALRGEAVRVTLGRRGETMELEYSLAP